MKELNIINNNELKNALKQQLNKLSDFCNMYDSGRYEYASEIALKIRVLLHNTRNSKSLYKMILNRGLLKKAPLFVDSRCVNVIDTHEKEFVAQFSSLMIEYEVTINDPLEEQILIPHFRKRAKYNLWSFDVWWDKLIVCQWHDNRLTRKDIVRLLSNQDGGAHVDEFLDNRLYALKRNLISTVTFTINNTKFTIESQLLFATIVRTIAEEVLIVFNNKILPNI